MRQYNICGEIVRIPTSTENYMDFYEYIKPVYGDVSARFDQWYGRQLNSKSVYNKSDDILLAIIAPIVDKGVEYLNQHGVYELDGDYIVSKYMMADFRDYKDACSRMILEVEDIEEEQQQAKEYRRMQKASRGRVVGGGYGLGGALKGMAQAGIMNAATGAFYSVGNAIGNTATAAVAGAGKAGVYSKYRSILNQEMQKTVADSIQTLMEVIQEYTNVRFEFLIDNHEPDGRVAKNILESYKQHRIPQEQWLKQLVIALRNAPEEIEPYIAIWELRGDSSGDLRRMAEFFQVPLNSYVAQLVEEHCQQISKSAFAAYDITKNPIAVAVEIEKQVLEARASIENYCTEQKIDYKTVKSWNKCNEILAIADKESRLVDGILYESREEAVKIKEDKNTVYEFLLGKNLDKKEQLQEALGVFKFKSNLFQNSLQDILNQEIELRNPTKISDNLERIFQKYFPGGLSAYGKVEYAKKDNAIEQKEGTIRTITSMPETEMPVVLVNYGSNGKSGILLTNTSLRIYSKGILSSENLVFDYKSIARIKCLGDNQIKLFLNTAILDVKIKSGLKIEEQNRLCDFLNEAIRLIKSLSAYELEHLKDIFPDSVKCVCGRYILNSQKICSNCFRMLTKEGALVETVECIQCKSRISMEKKFCSQCGATRIEVARTTELMVLKEPEIVLLRQELEKKKVHEPKFCAKCGAEWRKGKKFCSKCGNSITYKGEKKEYE